MPETKGRPVLEIHGIRKSFGKNHILRGLDLTVWEGEMTVLLGPSGSGKTTLLRCVNFLERAEEGTIRIDDLEANFHTAHPKTRLALRRKTAMVFQNYALFMNKSAGENIMEGLIISKKMRKAEARQKAVEWLDRVGLQGRFDARPYELSGGQQQRVGIARALALEPSVILFDEPTSALDPEMVGDILELIKEASRCAQKTGMIIVTHEMQFAYDVATNVVFMDGGVVVEQGHPKQVFDKPREERTKQFLSRFNFARAIEYTI